MSVCVGRLIHNVGRVTEGVACHDRTDASTDDSTDDRTTARQTTQIGQARTHEKADIAVVSAALPGEP